MSFKILYVTATVGESRTLKNDRDFISPDDKLKIGTTEISSLITGVGSVATAWAMMKWLTNNEQPDLIINGGIAGSYNDELVIGDVVMPLSDCFADSGIEDGNRFLTMAEAGLEDKNDFPYSSGLIKCKNIYTDKVREKIRAVSAITVNRATGSDITRNRMLRKFNPDIETMEGGTFFYICRRENIPFLALRAISNRVEKRNREKWDIPLALNNLSEKLYDVIVTLK
jgi:futalosine hydrolase